MSLKCTHMSSSYVFIGFARETWLHRRTIPKVEDAVQGPHEKDERCWWSVYNNIIPLVSLIIWGWGSTQVFSIYLFYFNSNSTQVFEKTQQPSTVVLYIESKQIIDLICSEPPYNGNIMVQQCQYWWMEVLFLCSDFITANWLVVMLLLLSFATTLSLP